MPNTSRLLDLEKLHWGLKFCEHTKIAKNLIRLELNRRGVSDTQITNWLPEPIRITSISSSHVASSNAKYLLIVKLRRVLFSIYRLFAFMLYIALFLSSWSISDDGRTLWFEPSGPLEGRVPLLPLAEFLEGFLISIMILISSIATFSGRRRSLKVLLLRPFGRERISPALRKLVSEYIGPLATTYTISDKTYRPSFLQLIEQLFSLSWRIALIAVYKTSLLYASIGNQRTFISLARSLSHSIGPGFKTFVTGDQALRIKSTNDWWQIVVDMLMHSVDIIVVDVSWLGHGSTWELAQIFEQNLEEKCLFVCQDQFQQRTLGYVGDLPQAIELPILHIYTGRGQFKDLAQFDSEMSRLLTRALEERRKVSH